MRNNEPLLVILVGDMVLVIRLEPFEHAKANLKSQPAIDNCFLEFWGGLGHQKCRRIWPKFGQNIEKEPKMPGNRPN